MEAVATSVIGTPNAPLRHRVLITDATQGGVIGGSLTGILELIPHLDRRRLAPELVLAEPKPTLQLPGVPVHVLATRARRRVAARCRSACCVARRRCSARPAARELLPLLGREHPAMLYLANGVTSNLQAVAAVARVSRSICHFKGFRRVGPIGSLLSRWIDTAITMTDEIGSKHNRRAASVRAAS